MGCIVTYEMITDPSTDNNMSRSFKMALRRNKMSMYEKILAVLIILASCFALYRTIFRSQEHFNNFHIPSPLRQGSIGRTEAKDLDIWIGGRVSLRSMYNGRFLSVQGPATSCKVVLADQLNGDQEIVLDVKENDVVGVLNYAETVFLESRNGNHINVAEKSSVEAKWRDKSGWQGFQLRTAPSTSGTETMMEKDKVYIYNIYFNCFLQAVDDTTVKCLPWIEKGYNKVVYMFEMAHHQPDHQWFWLGSDLSSSATYENGGLFYRNRNTTHVWQDDIFQIMRSHNWNLVRLRLWVNPLPDEEYAGFPGVSQLARRLTSLGLKWVLDFHYSDNWADPKKQRKPPSWRSLHFDALVQRVYEYTRSTLEQLREVNALPTFVQVGNEINNGMLWHEADESCIEGGKLWQECGANWESFTKLATAGINAVHHVSDDVDVIMHTGNSINALWWYTELGKHMDINLIDVFGLSYYQKYNPGYFLNNLETNLKALSERFKNHDIHIAETTHPYRHVEDSKLRYPETAEFPFTAQGQQDYAQGLINVVKSVRRATAVTWWGGDWCKPGDTEFHVSSSHFDSEDGCVVNPSVYNMKHGYHY